MMEILEERGKRYGSFDKEAEIVQGLKFWLPSVGLDPDQRLALELIFLKIARIINGDPNYIDNWEDISGYAILVANRMRKEKAPV